MPSILYVFSRPARFVELDREILRERWRVRDWEQPGRLANPLSLLVAVARSDLVFGWFASWHTFLPVTFAWLLGKPSVLVVGGFDVASEPEIGYGYQRGGPQRWLSRWIMGRATRLVTNSEFSRHELAENAGFEGPRVAVVHHGVPDSVGGLPSGARQPIAVTVSNVARLSVERKGLRSFVEAAAFLPEVSFVLVGRWLDDAVDDLRAAAAPNVTLAGWLSRAELDDLLARASAYVQASAHEGFGLSVAEAMLAGCIPVVTGAGALPEVVGGAGIQIPDRSPDAVAEGVRQALRLGEDSRRQARERVLARFPLDRRRAGLQALVAELIV